jgi:hypothetical protein
VMSIRRHQRDDAGLRPGDVIDEVNRQPVSSGVGLPKSSAGVGQTGGGTWCESSRVTAFLVVEPDYF